MAKTKIETRREYDRFDVECIKFSRKKGTISQRDIYEWSEVHSMETDGNTYITIPATYDGCKETPDELYEEGDEMLVYNLYDVLDNLIDLAITKYGWSPSVATAKRLDKEINTLRPFFQNIGA